MFWVKCSWTLWFVSVPLGSRYSPEQESKQRWWTRYVVFLLFSPFGLALAMSLPAVTLLSLRFYKEDMRHGKHRFKFSFATWGNLSTRFGSPPCKLFSLKAVYIQTYNLGQGLRCFAGCSPRGIRLLRILAFREMTEWPMGMNPVKCISCKCWDRTNLFAELYVLWMKERDTGNEKNEFKWILQNILFAW